MDGYRDEDISIQGQIPSSGQKHHRANSTTTLNTRRSKWGAWNQALYMLASAVLGIAFAVSHHFFHASLDGKPVRSTTSQQWNGRVSLGFSLLVRYCFKISIGIAFVQCFWAGVKAYATKLDTTDSVFMLLTSPLGFFKLRVWKFYPLLVTLSLLSWFLPFATIVAPPSLEIRSASFVQQYRDLPVPQIDFTSGFAQGTYDVSDFYGGPNFDLQHLVLSTASTGIIQPVIPTWANSSYNLTFFGPSVECLRLENVDPPESNRSDPVAYYVSAPLNGFNHPEQLNHITGLDIYQFPLGTTPNQVNCSIDNDYYTSLNTTGGEIASLYVFYGLPNYFLCTLFNTSYDTEFAFDNGQQKVQVRNLTRLNEIRTNSSKVTCYDKKDPDCVHLQYLSAYQCIFHALSKLIMGWIASPLSGGEGTFGQTDIFQTSLIYSNFFNGWRRDKNIQGAPGNFNLNRTELPDGIEQLMQNITLSLFSTARFTQPSPPEVRVAIEGPQLIYNYAPRNLIYGYATAAVFTVAALLLGVLDISKNRATYENRFSTIIRTSRHPDLDALIRPRDTDGANPLPGYLEESKIQLTRFRDQSGQGQYAFCIVDGETNVQDDVVPKTSKIKRRHVP